MTKWRGTTATTTTAKMGSNEKHGQTSAGHYTKIHTNTFMMMIKCARWSWMNNMKAHLR